MKYYGDFVWKWNVAFVLLVILHNAAISTIEASPFRERHKCGVAQCKESKKFHYKGGSIYSYDYSVNVTTSIEGGPSEQSGLHMSSAIAIKFLTPCEAILSMRDVQVWESHLPSDSEESSNNHHFKRPDSDETFSKGLQQFPLRFSYVDGVIEEICPNPEESILMLNVKRGLLSSFQNTMRRLDLEHKGEEDDIHGRCKTEYRLGTATASNLTIERTKDIGSCGDKFGILSSVHGTPYHFGTLHQSMPAVSSTSDCEHVVDRTLVSSVQCCEIHKLQSLSRGTGAAQTEINQQLDLTSVYDPSRMEGSGNEEEGIPTVSNTLDPMFAHLIPMDQWDIVRRETLQFRHDYHVAPKSNDRTTAQGALRTLCDSLKDGVGKSAGDSFETLISVLRGLESADMMSLSEEATDICQGDRTPFDDALEAVGTKASVHVMKERILKNDGTEKATVQSWIDSLTYIPRPSLGVMEEAVDILRERGNYPQILLSFSTLAHSYCKTNSNCSAHRPIDILSRLYKKFFAHTGCVARHGRDVEQILMYLKGIGNFGLYSLGVRDAVARCIQRNDKDRTEIRVAAIEAYRRMGCTSEMDLMKSIFKNPDEDSEVRIAAFLSIMKCPNYETIKWIRKLLDVEEVNQVGSFVVSYLRNLQETALPSKAELQGLVSDENFSKKFSTDFRKFSRSFEVSSFYDDFNFGAGLESNLIFSQKSYLPRSASLNLTVDLFGESINVFEASVRLENFEHHIESLFGPNGKFRNKELYSIVSSFREKRATPNKRKLKQLAVEFDAMRRYNLDPIASLSLKTFGNEIMYKRSVGVGNHSKLFQAINPFEWVKTLTKQSSNFQKSKMFLDSTYIIPTGMGLPLNLTAQASALIKMDSETEFISESSEFKVKGKFKPSAILVVTGSMAFGTTNFQTGIKIKAHLRTSTAIDSTFHIRGTELIEAEFGLPQTQLELLEYKSELLFVQGRIGRIVGQHPQKPLVCSGGFLEEMFGLKVCRSFHFNLSPNSEVDDLSSPYFPLNGPAFFNVILQKADPSHLTSKVTYISIKNETNSKLEATYGIKSAQQTKSFGLTYDMDRINQNLAFGVTLPGKKLTLIGMVGRNGSVGKVDVTAVSNNVQVLGGMISFVKTGEGNGKGVLKPEILIKLYNSRILDGNAELRTEEKEGGLAFDGSGVVKLDAESPSPVNMRLNGFWNATRLEMLELEVEYEGTSEGTGTSMQKIHWKSAIKAEKRTVDEEVKDTIDTNFSLTFSQFPHYNLEASSNYQMGEDTLSLEGEIHLGRGPGRSSMTVRMQNEEKYGGRDMMWLFEVRQPMHESQWGVEGSFKSAGNSLNSTIKVQYAPGKKIEGSLALERAPAGALALFGVGIIVQTPNQHPLTLRAHLKETAPRSYEGKVGGNWFGRASLSTQMKLVDRTWRHKLDKDVGLRIEFGTSRPEELLNVRCHIYSDDKEAKLTLTSQHERKNYSWELGYTQIKKGSKRHRLYSNVQANGPPIYSLTIESGIDDKGLEVSIETDLNAKFCDIYAGLRVMKGHGVHTIGLDYKWDASRDASKAFTLLFLLDASQGNHAKYKFLLKDPQTNFVISAEQKQENDRSKSMRGRISWSATEQIEFSGHLNKISRRPHSYDLLAEASTPFNDIKNASLKIRVTCDDEDLNCGTTIEGSWGLKGKLSGFVSSTYEVLPVPEVVGEEIGSDEGTEDDIDEEEDSTEFSRGRRGVVYDKEKTKGLDDMSLRRRLQPEPGYKFRFNSNMTTTLEGWDTFGINIQHTHNDLFHLKTDIDIQLPGKRDWSISNEWYVPRKLKEIWSTRVHLQAKTPLPNYQSIDLQVVAGHQEDSDKLATFGIYTDQFQYSLTITGTPRLDPEDGSLGFVLVTPLPNYDKIFGTLSYNVGESSRLACQLGWPKVLIGVETGFEWTGSWDEFQTFFTFNSPWQPFQNINTLAKIDTSQAEFKFLLNDEGLTAKTEWVLETLYNFDLRLDVTSPFPTWRRVGLIAKQSLDGSDDYYSHISGWVNEVQIGYKWEGSSSDLEDEDVEGSVMKCEMEIDTIVYPTIRVSSNVVRRESKYSAHTSVVLREGPINLSVELNLLGAFRFNEKIRVTTPYPGLLELEINFRPAFIPEQDLYNFGFDCKWRRYDEQEEIALIIRKGNQVVLSEALTQDLEDEAEEPEDDADDKVQERPKVIVPMSQLFHFSTPWKLTKTFKIEVERVSDETKLPQDGVDTQNADEEDEDAEEENDEDDEEGATVERVKITHDTQFPWKTVLVQLDSSLIELNFNIQNEIRLKSLSAGLSLPEIESPLSLKFQSKLDLENSEKKLSVEGTSHWPELQEIQLESSYQKEKDFVNMRIDLQTPFPSWEGQHASLMYAHSTAQAMDTLDLELSSEEYGKLATNIVRSPLSFGIILNTPFEGYTSIEFEATSELLEDAEEETYETMISVTVGDKEILKIEAESTMENHFPKMVNGTIRTTLEEEQGNFGVLMRGTPDELNANGQIQWRNEKVSFGLRHANQLPELDLKVTTPFKGYEKWKIGIRKVDDDEDEDDEDVDNEDENSEESESVNFLLNAETPWSQFSPLKGKVKITMAPSSLLGINGLKVSGSCPNGNVGLQSSWILSSWNRFEIQSHSKYSHTLDIHYMSSIPKANFLKFKIRNFIPNFDVLDKVDSSIYFQTLTPKFRIGSSVLAEVQDGASATSRLLTVNLTSTLPTTAHSLHLNSNFDPNFRTVTSEVTLTHLPSTQIGRSNLEIERKETSLEGKLDFEWDDTKAQSKFNCAFSPTTYGLKHLQANVSLPSSSAEVIGSIDATFENNPLQHKVRIQGKRSGDTQPLLVDLDLSGHWNGGDKYVNSTLTIDSPYDDIPSSNIFFQGRLDDGIFGKIGGNVGCHNGSFEGHWVLKELEAGSVQVNGTVEIEGTIGIFESGKAEYYSLVKDNEVKGLFKMFLNNVEHVDSTYKYETAVRQGSEFYASQFRFANQFWPFGITKRYLHEYTPGAPQRYPDSTVQLVEVYDLVHSDLHKLGCELRIERTFNGREITLTGLHPLRNVSFTTKYETVGKEFRQNASFSWAQGSRLGYDFRLEDLSDERKLEQQMELRVHYPVRVIRFSTGYVIEEPNTSGQLWTELDLNATNREQKGLKGIVSWDYEHNAAMTLRKASAIIKHPLLPQDVRGGGELRVTNGDLIEGKLSLDYSGDPKRRLTFGVKVIPRVEGSYFWNLTTDLRLHHAVTNLDLKAFHSNRHLPHELSIITLIDFKNSGKLSRESKIAFELFKQLKKLQLMVANPEEHFDLACQIQERGGIYHFVADTNITGYSPPPKFEMTVDTLQPYFRLTAVHGKDGSKGVYGEGGVLDSRNVKFDISESYDNFRFSDINFFLRMNHSRLVTSKLIWRPELLEELQASHMKRIEDLKEIWNHQSDKLLLSLWTDSTQLYNQVWENAKTTIEPFIEEIRKQGDFGKDAEALSEYFENAVEQNDFYLDDMIGLAQIFADQVSLRFSNVFINLREYRASMLGDTSMSEHFENALLWVLEKAKDQYRTITKLWDTYKPRTSDLTSKITFQFPDFGDVLTDVASHVVELGIRICEAVSNQFSTWMSSVGFTFQEFLEQHRPTIASVVHKMEVTLYQMLLGVSDFIYETRDEVVKSTYYQKLTQMAQDIDQLYRDLLQQDFSQNTSKYYAMFINFIQKKTSFDQLKKHFDAACQKFATLWSKFLDLSYVKDMREGVDEFSATIQWIAEYTHFEELLRRVSTILYEKGPELMRQTVLEANAKYQQAKTKFIFDADKGIVDWEQKLPMPWSAFNAPPRFTELPEYQRILKLKEQFHSSRSSIFDVLYQPTSEKGKSWFPPFDGHALVADSSHFFTFDGKSYNLKNGSSVYFLGGDLVEGNFSISIDYRERSDRIVKANIIVTSGHNTLIIHFPTKTLRDPKHPQNVGLPIQMRYLQGYRDGETLTVQSAKGEFSVDCNLVYGLCQFKIGGWHSRKVGGLLGTMDHEPRTDMILSNGKVTSDLSALMRSWDVSDDGAANSSSTTGRATVAQREPLLEENSDIAKCKKFFSNPLSSLQPCFSVVDVKPYVEICSKGEDGSDMKVTCLAAITYSRMCKLQGVEVQIPSVCIKCDLNGETMIDGDVKVMDKGESSSTRSTDIVFVVEAKDCNKNAYSKRNIETLVNTMEQEFKKFKIINNRYAIVTFGGDGVFERPHSILVKGELFTEFDKLGDHFKRIQTSFVGSGSRDTFGAVVHALNLNFRPGVAKVLILLPCTPCQLTDMTIDLSTVQHGLLEQAASLHVLLHKELEFEDKELGKKFFGMDNEVVFTKADGGKAGPLTGNRILRANVKVPKRTLGYCAPLALQTNGTIFNGKKLQQKREPIVNSFSRVFSRRIAKAVEPITCHSCSCIASNDGIGQVKCLRCDYQRPNTYNQEGHLENETGAEGTDDRGSETTTLSTREEQHEDNEEADENEEDPMEEDYEEYPDGTEFR